VKKEEPIHQPTGCLSALMPYLIIGFIVLLFSLSDGASSAKTTKSTDFKRLSSSGQCEHSWQSAKDGSRCGKRAADEKPGGS
jgi:hypothetical protein